MKLVQMSEETAIKLYANNESIRPMLIETFGEELFNDRDEKCKTVTIDEAYKAIGWEKPRLLPTGHLGSAIFFPKEIQPFLLKLVDLIAMNEYANNGKRHLWEQTDLYKYQPYYKVSPSGFSFLDSRYDFSFPYAGGASRLCLNNEKRARNLGNNPEYMKIVKELLDL